MDKAQGLADIVEQVQTGLIQLGLCRDLGDVGLTVVVSFKTVEFSDQGDGGPADFALLEVDLPSLPRGVTVPKLTSSATLHHLGAVVGKPVHSLNTSGVTYCVDLRPAAARRAVQLAERVDFDGDAHPDRLALGMTRKGPLTADPERLGNVLVVGAQGAGKSAFLRLLVYQFIKSGWRLLLADPDQATFNPYLWRGAECLLSGNVATSPSEVAKLFALALAEVERRANLYRSAPGYPDSLSEYNARAAAPLPRLAVVVDEANTFFADRALVEGAADLARRARKWGLHVVLAGHNWRAADIPRGLSAMLQTRVAFRVSDNTSGAVVLERAGAETLPAVPGRAIIRLGGEYHLMQACFLDKARLVKLVERLPKSEPVDWADLADPRQDDGDGDRVERIRQLHAEGLSKRQIQMEVFGYTGGKAFDVVSAALKGGTTTTERGGAGDFDVVPPVSG